MILRDRKPQPSELAKNIRDLLKSTYGSDSPIRDISMSREEIQRFVFCAHALSMTYLSICTWQPDGELPEHTLNTHIELIKLVSGHDEIKAIGDFFIDSVELAYLPSHLQARWKVSCNSNMLRAKLIPFYMMIESASTMRFARIAADVQKVTGGPMEDFQIVNTTGVHLVSQVFEVSDEPQQYFERSVAFAAWSSMLLEGMINITEKYT